MFAVVIKALLTSEGMKDLDNVSAAEGSSRLTNMGFVPVGSAIDEQVCADARAFAVF